ncbi:hypothetical protein [Cyanobium gracile]|uniref:hypothetical protein n=1 Tax=Cyanobium gracile TaxID=59930 RepID=UPI001FDFF405|nr:hypothetical protein [Cyanobium gracile]
MAIPATSASRPPWSVGGAAGSAPSGGSGAWGAQASAARRRSTSCSRACSSASWRASRARSSSHQPARS